MPLICKKFVLQVMETKALIQNQWDVCGALPKQEIGAEKTPLHQLNRQTDAGEA